MVRLHLLQSFDGVSLHQHIHFDCGCSELREGNCGQRHHCESMKRRSHALRLLMRSAICRYEMNLVGLEGFRDRLGSSEVTVMDRIKSSAKDSDPHDGSVTW